MGRNLSSHPGICSVKRSTIVLAFVCLLAAASVAGAGASVTGVPGSSGVADGSPSVAAEDPFGQMDIDADDVLMEAAVEADGDAVWTIEYRTRLDTEDEADAFEELREDVEADPEAYTDRFRERMETTVDASAEATGREMSVSDVSVTAERRDLPREYGVLSYEFRWSGFAAADGSRVTAGDALEGLFLDDETAFVVSWPETHRLVDAIPSPTETRDRSVVWAGPIDFTGEEPRVTVDSDAADGGGDGTGDGANGSTGLPGSPWIVAVGFGALLVALAIAVSAYRRRESRPDESGTRASGAAAGGASSGANSSTSTDPSGTDDGSVAGPDADEDTNDDDGASAAVDAELLSNEEQVLRLIEEHGGRMKQAEVADELDWTAAKTSQVVTGLRDDGDLEGFRLGRENVLSLPDTDE